MVEALTLSTSSQKPVNSNKPTNIAANNITEAEDKVTISEGGKTVDGEVKVIPSSKETIKKGNEDILNRIRTKLNRLLDDRLSPEIEGKEMGFNELIWENMERHEGKIALSDGEAIFDSRRSFRSKLSKLMGIPISKAGLDAHFGDQDGKLDEEDLISLEDFERYIDEAIDYYEARYFYDSFISNMGKDRIVIFDANMAAEFMYESVNPSKLVEILTKRKENTIDEYDKHYLQIVAKKSKQDINDVLKILKKTDGGKVSDKEAKAVRAYFKWLFIVYEAKLEKRLGAANKLEYFKGTNLKKKDTLEKFIKEIFCDFMDIEKLPSKKELKALRKT